MGLRDKVARNYREFRSFQDGYIPHMVESEAFADWFLAIPEFAEALRAAEAQGVGGTFSRTLAGG
jgi:hypothetical protein